MAKVNMSELEWKRVYQSCLSEHVRVVGVSLLKS